MTRSAVYERLTAGAIGDHLDTTRYLECELFIGHSNVFLQIREGKRRLSALSVDRHETGERERGRLDRKDQPIILRLARFGLETKGQRVRRQPGRRIDEGRREVAR